MGNPKVSRVPEVYNQLLALILAEPEIEKAFLVDGGAPINDYSDYVVLFGYRPNSEDWVTATRAAPEGMAANDIETISIGVLVAATDAGHDMAAARAKVADKAKAIERVVTRDMSLELPGVVATIPGVSWQPLHTDKGAECNLALDIQVKATL